MQANILCTYPRNLQEQERLFFQSECTINPVFEYDSKQVTQAYVQQFEFEEDPEILEIAKKILKAFVAEYKSEYQFVK